MALAALSLACCFVFGGCADDGSSSGVMRSSGAFQPLMELDGSEPESLEEAPASENPIEPVEGRSFPVAEKDLTVMVYLVGSDLETNGGCATADLSEMIGAEFDADRMNVVIYTGGAQRWHVEIPNDCNCVLEATPGHLQKVAQTERSLNMGEADTLTSFITWTIENYPSERTALVLWDHGAGPALGYGFDQLYSMDSLSLEEQDEAMLEAGYGIDRMLDWVGFDACLMDSVEVLQVWEDYARYFVGSQEVEDGYGWDYSFLSEIDDMNDPAEAVRSIVGAFESFHAEDAMRNRQPNYTLAAIDLSAVSQLEHAIDGLSVSVLADFKQGNYATVAKARGQCRSFGATSGSVTTGGTSLVDLGDLAKRVAKAHPDEAAAIAQALDAAVIANCTNLVGAHGLSLYFPMAGTEAEVESPTDNCSKMIMQYAVQGQSASELNWAFAQIERKDGKINIALDSAQVRSLASASYTILGDFQGRGYCPLMSDVQVQPNGKGILRIPEDPDLIVTSGDNSAVVPLVQVDGSAERQVYRCDGLHVLPGTDFVSAPYGEQGVTLLLSHDATTGEVGVSSAYYQSSDVSTDGRANIDLLGFKTLMFMYGGWNYPQRADDGTMLPYSQWVKNTGRFLRNELPLGADIAFETRKVSEMPNDCVLQVVVTDINGVRHASELLPLDRVEDTVVVRKTEQGKFVFVLKEDHAELDDYSGTDERLEVPAKVKGLPVTHIAKNALSSSTAKLRELVLPSTVREIGAGAISAYYLEKIELGKGLQTVGNGAFAQCASLSHIDLPEGLRSIGRGVFNGLGATEIRLPASLESVGEGSFACCRKLEAFEVADGCRAVMVQDGVLFSTDGKTLMAFPAGRTGVYKAPKGTEIVGYGAFASTSLEAVVLPEGVKTVDNCAFCSSWSDDSQLASIGLPDSLERIGAYAFGTTYRGTSFNRQPFIAEVRLGKNLTSVGESAFTGLRIGRFIVDSSNEYFSSPGGFLANKAGDTIVEVPGGLGQVIVVPDGITTICEEAFSLYPAGIEIVVPESVSRISALAFPCHYIDISGDLDASRVYDVTFHCVKGSAAAKFADRRGIAWDETMDPAALSYGEETVERDGVSMTFLVYSDHAVLHGMAITERIPDMALTIPAEVSGVPVTSIDALTDTSVFLDAWKSVSLPASLSSIDYRAFPLLRADEGFLLQGESEAFSVKDGVLFSPDGSELIAFSLHNPDLHDDSLVFSYAIPEGTRTIARGAFFSSQLEQVVFPGSLRVVRSEAFSGNYRLVDLRMNEGLERIEDRAIYCRAQTVALPSSVKHIGNSALCYDGYQDFMLPANLRKIGSFNVYGYNGPIDIGSDTLQIGSKLIDIGQGAFSSVNVKAFEVDPANTAFSSVDGLLMSGDGKTLLLCPAGWQGELHIPEGVEELEPGCLDEAIGITDVYFPDSAIGVDAYSASLYNGVAGRVTFHCKKGSAAAHYAQLHDIPWQED